MKKRSRNVAIQDSFGATILKVVRLAVGKRKFMKLILVLLCIGLGVASCELADENTRTTALTLPVEYVVAEENIAMGDTATFDITYVRPSDCYIFNGFNVEGTNRNQLISVQAIFFDTSECQDDQETTYEVPMAFVPDSPGTYEFKFWTGDNAMNEHQYITKTLIVNENTN